MTPADLRAWQAHMGYTYDSASAALGMARSAYARMLAGQTADGHIDHRTALACAAIAHGLRPWVAGMAKPATVTPAAPG
jgi:hypothetical protein